MSAVRPTTLFFICVATIFAGNCFAQQQQIRRPDFGVGPLEEVAEEVGGLLQLQWKDQNIALKRDWDERKKKVEKDEELEGAIEKLVEGGVDERRLRILTGRALGNPFGKERTGVEEAFFKIQSGLGGGGSSSSGGSGMRKGLSFSTRGLSGRASLDGDDVRFSFTETEESERNFEFRDNTNGKLHFMFSYDQLFIRFIQSEEGSTQLIWVEGDKVNAYVGRTFSDFVNENPQAANKLLFPLFQQLGIQIPMDKTDPHVLNSALTRLEQMQIIDEEEVKQLIKDLGSDSYETRKTASEKLAEGFDRWSAQIEKSLKDESLTFEAKARLKEIASDNVKSETDMLLTGQKLMESPEFLIGLFEVATDEQKTFVADQLEKVTGQNHGTDLGAWKEWLSTSGTK